MHLPLNLTQQLTSTSTAHEGDMYMCIIPQMSISLSLPSSQFPHITPHLFALAGHCLHPNTPHILHRMRIDEQACWTLTTGEWEDNCKVYRQT